MLAEPLLSKLFEALESAASRNEIEKAARPLGDLPSEVQKSAVALALVLSDFSKKASLEYLKEAPRLLSSLSLDELARWVGAVVRVAESSGAAAQRLLRQGSGPLLSVDPAKRDRLFWAALAVAERRPSLVLEFVTQAGELLRWIDAADLAGWTERLLAVGDYTTEAEFLRLSPQILPLIGREGFFEWTETALALAGEKNYGLLLFARTSPEVLRPLPDESTRRSAVLLIRRIGEASSDASRAEAVEAYRILPSLVEAAGPIAPALILRLSALAAISPQSAGSVIPRADEILRMVEPGRPGAAERLAGWFSKGEEVVMRDPERGVAYFSLSSKTSREALDEAAGGVSLAAIAPVLKPFVRALTGRDVAIRVAAPSSPPSSDGSSIFLPERIALFPTYEENFLWYRLASALQGAFIEFGSFEIEALPRLVPLYTIAETGRVLQLLRRAYLGIGRDLSPLIGSLMATRPRIAGMSPRGALIELLGQIALAGRTMEPPPDPLAPTLFEACRILAAAQTEEASAATSLAAAERVDRLLSPDEGEAGVPEGERMEKGAERVRGEGGDAEGGEFLLPLAGRIDPKQSAQSKTKGDRLLPEGIQAAAGESDLEVEENLAALAEGGGALYPEWDSTLEEYRVGWCRIREREVAPGPEEFGLEVARRRHAAILLLRRLFTLLRPEGRKMVRGEEEGEEIDLDRMIESVIDRKSGRTPPGRFYLRPRRGERSVAAAFLVDLSGSTAQRIGEGVRPVIEIEKEALILLSEALSALGDPFAIFGFSGSGREEVDVYVVKDFDDPPGPVAYARIGALSPMGQNRDGAAIRHASSRLFAHPAKTRLLILLSDGRPLDSGYEGSYAFADTRRALAEARAKGIHPFCITIDRQAPEYLPGMYGEVRWTVIDDPDLLPMRLPEVYRRLTT